MPPPEVPPREGLYSTPLSWEKPEPGLRMEPDFGLGNTAAAMNAGFGQTMSGMGNNQVLSNDEQRRLLAIAMNTAASTLCWERQQGTAAKNKRLRQPIARRLHRGTRTSRRRHRARQV
ncbi:hypothetical protein LB505_008307 [Fusarium chuoi]|nr:hypothetical protein LB505_008307 [Fusarium chuoi]